LLASSPNKNIHRLAQLLTVCIFCVGHLSAYASQQNGSTSIAFGFASHSSRSLSGMLAISNSSSFGASIFEIRDKSEFSDSYDYSNSYKTNYQGIGLFYRRQLSGILRHFQAEYRVNYGHLHVDYETNTPISSLVSGKQGIKSAQLNIGMVGNYDISSRLSLECGFGVFTNKTWVNDNSSAASLVDHRYFSGIYITGINIVYRFN